MTPEERQDVVDRYAERLRRLGPVVQALGWRDNRQQDLRFEVITDGLRVTGGSRILDIGCGFGDYHRYLSDRGLATTYVGCDLSPEILHIARSRHPGITFEQRDVLECPYPDQSFDYVCMSGLFNRRITDNEGFLDRMLAASYRICARGVAVNMTTDQVDYQDPELYYFNPERVLRRCRALSRHVALRHDYPLYEFTMFVFRDGNHSLAAGENTRSS